MPKPHPDTLLGRALGLSPETIHRYHQNRHSARQRGIEWRFSIRSWHRRWTEAGANALQLRGTGTYDLCLARHGDAGPYSYENTYITTNAGNLRDRQPESRAGAMLTARESRREMAGGFSRKRVHVGDRVFTSVAEAARVLGMRKTTARDKVKSGRWRIVTGGGGELFPAA